MSLPLLYFFLFPTFNKLFGSYCCQNVFSRNVCVFCYELFLVCLSAHSSFCGSMNVKDLVTEDAATLKLNGSLCKQTWCTLQRRSFQTDSLKLALTDSVNYMRDPCKGECTEVVWTALVWPPSERLAVAIWLFRQVITSYNNQNSERSAVKAVIPWFIWADLIIQCSVEVSKDYVTYLFFFSIF